MKIVFFTDLVLFALYTSIRRNVSNAYSMCLRNYSNLYVSTWCHTSKESQVRNFVLYTYFSSLAFWRVLSEFVLKILIFRQDLRISPSRISAPDMTAISLTVQVGARFRREGVAVNQYSLCP